MSRKIFSDRSGHFLRRLHRPPLRLAGGIITLTERSRFSGNQAASPSNLSCSTLAPLPQSGSGERGDCPGTIHYQGHRQRQEHGVVPSQKWPVTSEWDIKGLEANFEGFKGDRYPSVSVSDAFERFAARQILKDADLSDDELESGILGGGDDGGVDGAMPLALAPYGLGDGVMLAPMGSSPVKTKSGWDPAERGN